MMKITENVLPQKVFDKLYSIIINPNFPWYLQNNSVVYKDDGNFQFTHQLCDDKNNKSKASIFFEDFYNFLEVKQLLRSKINLLYRTNKIKEFAMHTDYGLDVEPYTTAIYYFNTNNGYTFFNNGTKIASVENRLVQFDGRTPHSGSTHTSKERFRIVLNINYRR
jgi:hypothetical protein